MQTLQVATPKNKTMAHPISKQSHWQMAPVLQVRKEHPHLTGMCVHHFEALSSEALKSQICPVTLPFDSMANFCCQVPCYNPKEVWVKETGRRLNMRIMFNLNW
jgi:hypothetical protein